MEDKTLETLLQERNTTVLNGIITLACERTGQELNDKEINNIIRDLVGNYPMVKLGTVKDALRKGGLGHFGITYKLTTQVISSWILKEVQSKGNTQSGITV